MIDKKKVIKGLECCFSLNACGLCPYEDDNSCSRTLQKNTTELLKESEPIKPYVDIDEYKCPDCKVKLTRQELLGDNVLFEDFFDYCPRCGRRIEW